VKYDLEEQVAEFGGEFLGVATLHCVQNFVRFFEEEGTEGIVSLFAVPGAAAGGAQLGLEREQIFEEFAWAAIGLFAVCGRDYRAERRFVASALAS
jgi:hypothetical protein